MSTSRRSEPDEGPLVLWASQTGNAEDFAARVAERLGGSQLVNMDDLSLSQLAVARDVLVVTSTFGDGGPPDNGADFWNRLDSPEAPALDGVRYAVLGIGDRSYDNFCGHARSIDYRLADLGATPMLERAECEAYDDEPMAQWADRITTLIAGPDEAPQPAPRTSGVATIARPATAELFTRAKPVLAPLCRSVRLTPVTAAKEVRQFGFDISEYDVSYAAGDSLGVYGTNSRFAVDTWLAATGLRGEQIVELDGAERTLREALTTSYDICRVTPNLLQFVAESCRDTTAAKALRAPKGRLAQWLVNRNGLDVVQAFPVHANPEQWQEVLVRLTPRQFSISSSPLISPNEVQLTVSVLRYRGSDGGAARRCVHDILGRPRRRRAGAGVPSAFAAFPSARGSGRPDDHGRPRHGYRAVPGLSAGTPSAGTHRPQLAVLRRSAPQRKLLLPRRFGRHGPRRLPQPVGPGLLP